VLLDRYEENKTMARNLAYLLPENLYRVFNETDLDKRKAAIADLWNEDGIFIDPLGVHQGHEKLNAAVTALQHQFPGSVFRVISPIQENFGVGRDSWEYGPPGGAALEKRHRCRQDEGWKARCALRGENSRKGNLRTFRCLDTPSPSCDCEAHFELTRLIAASLTCVVLEGDQRLGVHKIPFLEFSPTMF
jgi:SnoaL-like domain